MSRDTESKPHLTDEEQKARALNRWENEGGARAPEKWPARRVGCLGEKALEAKLSSMLRCRGTP